MKITKLLLGLSALAILSGCAIPGTKDNSSSTKESSKAASSEEVVYHTVTFSYEGDTTVVPSQKVKHGEPAVDPKVKRVEEDYNTVSWLYIQYYGPAEGDPDTIVPYYDYWKFEVYPVFQDITLYYIYFD